MPNWDRQIHTPNPLSMSLLHIVGDEYFAFHAIITNNTRP